MTARGWFKSASVVALVAFGCSGSSGGGASCTSKNLCPNDTPPTPGEISQCQSLVGNPMCGSLFQAYFDCAYAQQRCASDGTLDGPATQSAIEAHCAPQVASYQSCSGTTAAPPTCGYEGLPCCASGQACFSTGCCDPATNKCVGPQSACATTDTICIANACEACGAAGQPCCPTFGMAQPNPCPAGGCCKYTRPGSGVCVAEGGQCDAPDAGSAATICHAGSCSPCGNALGPCCPGGQCTESGTFCEGSSGTCMDCNGIGLPACP